MVWPILLAFLPVFLAGAAPAPAPNWTGRVTLGSNGAYVMGNPAAKVKLVEYLSFTCGHCAHFSEESSQPLKANYVAKGNVSVELRNAVRDQFDMTASLLSRCGGASRVFGNSELLMATQAQWIGKVEAFMKANGARIAKLPVTAQIQAIAAGTGMNAIMAKRGFTPAQLNACIASKTAQQQVVAMTREAWQERKISGTPAFLVNGVMLQNAGHWDVVEASLKTALEL